MGGIGRQPQRNVVLTGYYGAGKTSVARELSLRMRRPVVDAASELRRRSRRNLRVLLPIVAGEVGGAGEFLTDFTFRRESILDLSVPLAAEVDYPELLGDFSFLVFLDPPFEELLQRINLDPRYAELRMRRTDNQLHEEWLSLRPRMEQCNLQLGNLPVMRSSQCVLHSFFT